MRTISQRSLTATALVAAALVTMMVAGCPKGGGIGGLPKGPKVPGGIGGGLDPDACGSYAANEAGRKLHAFLDATKNLEAKTKETVELVKTSCKMMGEELQMAPGDLDKGETHEICERVITELKNDMKIGIKPSAKLKVDYKPAVCTVDVQAAAHAAAECEGKADADVGVKCEGTCSGTCEGKCNGKAGTGGNSGHCDGTCEGTCSGGCDGHADVNASAQCKASAEVKASVDVNCTEPELTIDLDAKMMIDKSKAELALNALKKGLPKILSVRARLVPLGAAVKTWAASALELKGAAKDLANSFKDQALCITGQISAAVGMMTNIQANVDVSVSVSVEASGSAGIK